MERKVNFLKGILVLAVMGLIVVGLSLGWPRGKAMTLVQTFPLEVFSAPSQVPAGESWVLLGSLNALPEDLVVAPAALGVLVVETQKISGTAMGIRIQVGAGSQGKLIRVSSASSGTEVLPDLSLGQALSPLAAAASFTDQDFVEDQLVVGGDHFIYGYFAREGVSLASVRIHNRATGAWTSQKLAASDAPQSEEAADAARDPSFVQVDELDTLPDTDGDGVYDFEEEPAVMPSVPEQMGVALAPGLNTLDLLATDEAGNASWSLVNVFSTCEPSGN